MNLIKLLTSTEYPFHNSRSRTSSLCNKNARKLFESLFSGKIAFFISIFIVHENVMNFFMMFN